MSATAARLLGRGGRVLGLAALAHARGQQAGVGPWYVLGPELVAVAEQVLSILEEGGEPESVAAAIGAAMGPEPATAPPAWTAQLLLRERALARVGQRIEPRELAPALARGASADELDPRTCGLAALAVGLCRSVDRIEAVCRQLEPDEQRALRRMSRLAGVQVEPGQPTRVRRAIRRLGLEEG